MAERGAPPRVPTGRRRVLGLIRSFTSPLLPDDYLELVNPLWSTREMRGRIERVERETTSAVTVLIKPGWEWQGHQPGQYLRLGIEVDGVHHWRAYSLTSDPGRPDGCISITPKLVPDGKVSPFLFGGVRPGTIVRLGGVEGTFVLPDPLPARLLFISAGSGITPIMSMLRSLDHRGQLGPQGCDVVHIHSARTREQVMFLSVLEELDGRHEQMRLDVRLTGERGRLEPGDLDEECPDWREREAFCSGPSEMLDALIEHWENNGDPDRLHFERFQPKIGGDAEAGEGGEVCFLDSDKNVECDGGTSILEAGEKAGLNLAFGCRIGICHTCVGTLKSGKLRDLRSGDVIEPSGQDVRICINSAEGDVELEL